MMRNNDRTLMLKMLFMVGILVLSSCAFLSTARSNQHTALNQPQELLASDPPSRSFHYETVDETGDVGYGIDFKLDTNDRPYISYSSFNGLVKYATKNDEGNWVVETVDHLSARTMTAVAIDGSGLPHLVYFDPVNNCLKYAQRQFGKWRIFVLNNNVGNVDDIDAPSLATDTHGHVHMVYYNKRTDCLMHGIKYPLDLASSVTGWRFEQIDAHLSLDFWPLPVIAVDPLSDHVRVAYYARGRLNHAVQLGWGSWDIETVDSYGGVNPSLSIGSNGRSVISYMYGSDMFEDSFCLMCGQQNEDGQWVPETVNPESRSGTDSSIGVDTNNCPHIAHIHYLESRIEHVRDTPQGWMNEFVAELNNEGIYGPGMVSLAIPTNQHVQIAYRIGPVSHHRVMFAS